MKTLYLIYGIVICLGFAHASYVGWRFLSFQQTGNWKSGYVGRGFYHK